MSSSAMVPSWLDDGPSLLLSEASSSEDSVSLDVESDAYTLAPETVLAVRS